MKIRTRGLFAGLMLAAVALAATATIDPNLYLNDIKFLASPELRGRGTGSPELEKAAAFLERNYRQLGIKPVGKSYLQPFPVTTDAALGKANRFQFTENGHATTLHFPDDFVPFNFSQTGPLAGAVVFAGYGITAPEYNYDDYAGLDVKGKIVLVLRHEPQESDEKSVFEGKTLHPARAVRRQGHQRQDARRRRRDPGHRPRQPSGRGRRTGEIRRHRRAPPMPAFRLSR